MSPNSPSTRSCGPHRVRGCGRFDVGRSHTLDVPRARAPTGIRWQRHWSIPRPGPRAWIATLALFILGPSLHAQQTERADLYDVGAGWQELGSFNGAVGSLVWQRLNDLLFEREADGALYQDLGDVSLGVGLDLGDDGDLDWDNSFYRRVVPRHEDLAPGEVVGPTDLSAYVDFKTLVSRLRLGYGVLTADDFDASLGFRVEAGRSLTLSRAAPSLAIGQRPLAEILEERDEDLALLLREPEPATRKSLLRFGAEGIGAATQWIADGIGQRSVDTERGAIFYEGYAEPITLYYDLGVPVRSELFRDEDTRLQPGDRVRHVVFLGLSPVVARVDEYGLQASYQRYSRFIRETTLVKESGNRVRVHVRNSIARGNEFIPLKVRPEVRILGILKLGYTFFEQIWDHSGQKTWELTYRLDLDSADGREALQGLLGESQRLELRAPAELAERGEGGELLFSSLRQGRSKTGFRRARLFSLFRHWDQRITSNEVVQSDGRRLREVVRTRATRLRERFGKHDDRRRNFLFIGQGEFTEQSSDAELSERLSSLRLITGIRDNLATNARVSRIARALDLSLPSEEPHSLLVELATVPEEEPTRLLADIGLSLGPQHVSRLAQIEEDEVWRELAFLLLGAAHEDVWSGEGARRLWHLYPARAPAHFASLAPFADSVSEPGGGGSLSPRRRFELARSTAARFSAFQRELREGNCLRCVARAFSRWRQTQLLQLLIARLATDGEGEEVGYEFQLFTDRMVAPIVVSNGVDYSLESEWQEATQIDSQRREWGTEAVTTVAERLDSARWDWLGSYRGTEASDARLRAGELFANVDSEQQDHRECWRLRLYSDQLFDHRLRLRVDLRDSPRAARADVPLNVQLTEIGEVDATSDLPFMVARHAFDVPLDLEGLTEGRTYTLLLRALNPEGLPVTEEQQLRFKVAPGLLERMPERCAAP